MKTSVPRNILFLFFSAVILLLFLTLGADLAGHRLVRTAGLYGLAVLILMAAAAGFVRLDVRSAAWWMLGIVIVFQAVRWASAQGGLVALPEGTGERFGQSFYLWGALLVAYSAAWWLVRSKQQLLLFLRLQMWIAFVFSLNIIPNLLVNGHTMYHFSDTEYGFFYPAVYFAEWVPKYLVGRFAFENFTGDVIVLGAFTGLALLAYALVSYGALPDPLEKRKLRGRFVTHSCLLAVVAGTILTTVVSMFSRGTIASLGVGVTAAVLLVILKLPRKAGLILLIVLPVTFGVVWFSGNLGKAWKEVQSLQEENTETGSLSTVSAGIRIAGRIEADNRIWGTGYKGYRQQADSRADELKLELRRKSPARFDAMNHYWHLRAEEGLGAWLYFGFLLMFGLEFLIRFFRVRSRLRAFAAAFCLGSVVMILVHASFGFLMQRFPVAALVCIQMGACLGMLIEERVKGSGRSQKTAEPT